MAMIVFVFKCSALKGGLREENVYYIILVMTVKHRIMYFVMDGGILVSPDKSYFEVGILPNSTHIHSCYVRNNHYNT